MQRPLGPPYSLPGSAQPGCAILTQAPSEHRIRAEPRALMNGKQAAQPVPGANDIQASFV